jgi:hypothetical protein
VLVLDHPHRSYRIAGRADVNHPASYQIRIRGQLGRTMRTAFPALRAQTQGQDTLLAGELADQAALYGVLTQIEALGLELIEVRRLPREAPATGSSQGRRESPGRVTPPHPGGQQAEDN